MKHPKKINVEMKKMLSKCGLDATKYWFIKNTTTEVVFVDKNDTSRSVTINKKSGEVVYG